MFVFYAVRINWQGFPLSACNMCNTTSSLHAPPAVVVTKSSMGQTDCQSYIPRQSTQNLWMHSLLSRYQWLQSTHVNVFLFMSTRTVKPYWHQCPRMSYMLHSMTCRSHRLQHQTINMEITKKLIYDPKYGFHCADFHETHNHSIHIHVDISCTEFHLNRMKNAQNIGKVSFATSHKLGIHEKTAKWHYVAIICIIFLTINQSINMASMNMNLFYTLTQVGLWLDYLSRKSYWRACVCVCAHVRACKELLHCIS